MSSKAAYRTGMGAGLGLLLLAVLVVGNYLSARFISHRFDLTAGGQFSVAPATKELLGALDDVVNVKLYFSKNVPEQAANIPARVRDLVTELEAHAKGRLRVEWIDPLSSPETEQKVQSMGIPKVPLTVLEKNKQDTREVYLGMALLYGAETQVIPAILDDRNLEYEVVSRLAKLTQPKKTIGFLTGHGERDSFGELAAFAEQLREQYDVRSVSFTGGAAVPDEVSTLIVAGPREPLPARHRYEIDQFLMRGGHLFFLIDRFDVNDGTLMVRPLADPELIEQIASYGVRVKPALAADWEMHEFVRMPAATELGFQAYVVTPYPLWPKLVEPYLSETHPVVAGLSGIVLPWTSPLEAVKDQDDAFEVVPLAHSTENAQGIEQVFNANPRLLTPPEEKDLSKLLLIAAVTGPQRSYFAGQPAPEAEPAAGADATATAPEAPAVARERKERTEAAQIVVLGTSDAATDAMVGSRNTAANLVFLLNAVDWLTVGDRLIGIRSRTAALPFLDPRRRALGEKVAPWINIAVLPALVVAFGLIWRAARRRRRVVFA